jgi:hypothetical protein
VDNVPIEGPRKKKKRIPWSKYAGCLYYTVERFLVCSPLRSGERIDSSPVLGMLLPALTSLQRGCMDPY